MNYNYIKHLNTWFIVFSQSDCARPVHASLYFGLFQLWNINRFSDGFYCTRSELMKVSKIASTETYSRVMREMVEWGWIEYTPGNVFFSCSYFKVVKHDVLANILYEGGDTIFGNPMPSRDVKDDPSDSANDDFRDKQSSESSDKYTTESSSKQGGECINKTNKQYKTAKNKNNNLNKKDYNEPL